MLTVHLASRITSDLPQLDESHALYVVDDSTVLPIRYQQQIAKIKKSIERSPSPVKIGTAALAGTGLPVVACSRARPLVPEWDLIPGARGCTPESCAFRDHADELRTAGAAVLGLSTQDTAYQREAAERLHLPFPLLSDSALELTTALGLPTLDVAGLTLLRRFTLVIRDGMIEHCFYPVFPPDGHVAEVLTWLRANR